MSADNEVSVLTYGLLDAVVDGHYNIAVPTAVTGFYGQNIPYPGFERHSGFIVSTLIMIGLAGGIYLLLRRNKWL